MTKFLVVGGAGYIGSHLVKQLIQQGAKVIVLDDFSTGHREAVPQSVPLYQCSLYNPESIRHVFTQAPFDAVFHFAAKNLVGDSINDPLGYFQSNVTCSLNLIQACVAAHVPKFVFSSTAAVYGEPQTKLISETHPLQPLNPYGESKLMIERMLKWAETLSGMRWAALRYFNAAGCDPLGELGEAHFPETHLIPSVIDAALGRRPPLQIFGTDYPTPDGTAIRDYVHVTDLASAHLAVLPLLDQQSACFNLGNSEGFSVSQIIQAVESVTGMRVPREVGSRRAGDPARLVANSQAIRQAVGWVPEFSALDTLIDTSYKWRLTHPKGYNT